MFDEVRRHETLKGMLFEKLTTRPLVRSFFENMLHGLTSHSEWLDNALVQIVLLELDNLDLIEHILACVYRHSAALFNSMSLLLSGYETDFEGQLGDLLAELNGAVWIVDHGYQCVTHIPRGRHPSPDFEAEKEAAWSIFEVKNLRAPTTMLDLLMTKIQSLHLLRPELTDHLSIKLSLPLEEDYRENPSDVDKEVARRFLCEFESAVSKGQLSMKYAGDVGVVSGRGNYWIAAECRQSDSFGIIGLYDSAAICLSDSNRRKRILDSLENKVRSAVDRAVQQLSTRSSRKAVQKFVLLNWQKTPAIHMDEDLESEFKGLLHGIRESTRHVREDVELILL